MSHPSRLGDDTVYLGLEELARRTPWTADAIRRMIRRGMLVEGKHFFQPGGHRGKLIFDWAAVEGFIRQGRGRGMAAPRGQDVDVEAIREAARALLG